MGASSKCPYGYPLPGDVTLPYPITVWSIIGVSYGYVPYSLAVLVALEALIKRSTRCIAFGLFIGLAVIMGEIVFKHIVNSPRPAMSCLHSCGMPSSHATLSIGYFTLMLLDALRRYKNTPRTLRDPESRRTSWCMFET